MKKIFFYFFCFFSCIHNNPTQDTDFYDDKYESGKIEIPSGYEYTDVGKTMEDTLSQKINFSLDDKPFWRNFYRKYYCSCLSTKNTEKRFIKLYIYKIPHEKERKKYYFYFSAIKKDISIVKKYADIIEEKNDTILFFSKNKNHPIHNLDSLDSKKMRVITEKESKNIFLLFNQKEQEKWKIASSLLHSDAVYIQNIVDVKQEKIYEFNVRDTTSFGYPFPRVRDLIVSKPFKIWGFSYGNQRHNYFCWLENE